MTVVAFPAVERHRSLAARTNPDVARGAANDALLVDLALADGDPAAVRRACRSSDLRRVEIELVAPATDGGSDYVLDAVLEILAHGGSIRTEAAALRDVSPYTELDFGQSCGCAEGIEPRPRQSEAWFSPVGSPSGGG